MFKSKTASSSGWSVGIVRNQLRSNRDLWLYSYIHRTSLYRGIIDPAFYLKNNYWSLG